MSTASKKTGTGGNFRVVFMCLGMAFGMGGLAYASVPLYQLFCQVTGYGGTTQKAENIDGIPVLDREITILFDANVSSSLDWEFGPVQREVKIKLGEISNISYLAKNLTDEKLHGTATFNVTPQAIGSYFNKVECFCFTDTRIEANGSLDMPVQFFIDPELDKEERFKSLQTITLSYTFFPTPKDEIQQEQASSTEVEIDEKSDRL